MTDKTLVAEEFNKFFLEVSSALTFSLSDLQKNDILRCKNIFKIKSNVNSVFWCSVTEEEVNDLISKLSPGEACGNDGISAIFVKQISHQIVPI